MPFKFCKKCAAMRQFLPNGYDAPRHCDVCGADESLIAERIGDSNTSVDNHSGGDDALLKSLNDGGVTIHADNMVELNEYQDLIRKGLAETIFNKERHEITIRLTEQGTKKAGEAKVQGPYGIDDYFGKWKLIDSYGKLIHKFKTEKDAIAFGKKFDDNMKVVSESRASERDDDGAVGYFTWKQMDETRTRIEDAKKRGDKNEVAKLEKFLEKLEREFNNATRVDEESFDSSQIIPFRIPLYDAITRYGMNAVKEAFATELNCFVCKKRKAHDPSGLCKNCADDVQQMRGGRRGYGTPAKEEVAGPPANTTPQPEVMNALRKKKKSDEADELSDADLLSHKKHNVVIKGGTNDLYCKDCKMKIEGESYDTLTGQSKNEFEFDTGDDDLERKGKGEEGDSDLKGNTAQYTVSYYRSDVDGTDKTTIIGWKNLVSFSKRVGGATIHRVYRNGKELPYDRQRLKQLQDDLDRGTEGREGEHECKSCGFKTVDFDEYKDHMKAHGKPVGSQGESRAIEQNFICDWCKSGIHDWKDMERHLKTVHGIKNPDFETIQNNLKNWDEESKTNESVTSWWGSLSISAKIKILKKVGANPDPYVEYNELPEDLQDGIFRMYSSGYENATEGSVRHTRTGKTVPRSVSVKTTTQEFLRFIFVNTKPGVPGKESCKICRPLHRRIFEVTDKNRPVIPRLEPEKLKGYNFTHPSCECRWEPVTATEAMDEFIKLHTSILQENYPNAKVEIMMGTMSPVAVAHEMVGEELHVHGVLAIAGISHNRRIYLPEQLARGHGNQLPVIFNHATPYGIEMEMSSLPIEIQKKIKNFEKINVGETRLTWDQEKLTLFHETVIRNPFFIKEIQEGRMSVSLGMIFEDTADPVCDEVCYTVVKEGQFQEMSLVYHAGFPHANITINESRLWLASAHEHGGPPPYSLIADAKTVKFKTNKEDETKEKQMDAKEDQYSGTVGANTISTDGSSSSTVVFPMNSATDTLSPGNIPDIKFHTVLQKSLIGGLEQYQARKLVEESMKGVESFFDALPQKVKSEWLKNTGNEGAEKFQMLNSKGQDKIVNEFSKRKGYSLPKSSESSTLARLMSFEFNQIPTEIKIGLEKLGISEKMWHEMKVDYAVSKATRKVKELRSAESYEVRSDKGLLKRTDDLLFAKLLAEKYSKNPTSSNVKVYENGSVIFDPKKLEVVLDFENKKINEDMWAEMKTWWNSLSTSEQRDIIKRRGGQRDLDMVDKYGGKTDFNSLTDLQADIVAPEYNHRRGLSGMRAGVNESRATEVDKDWWESKSPVEQEQILIASQVDKRHKGLKWINLGPENQKKIQDEYGAESVNGHSPEDMIEREHELMGEKPGKKEKKVHAKLKKEFGDEAGEDSNSYQCRKCDYQSHDREDALKHTDKNPGHQIEMHGKGEESKATEKKVYVGSAKKPQGHPKKTQTVMEKALQVQWELLPSQVQKSFESLGVNAKMWKALRESEKKTSESTTSQKYITNLLSWWRGLSKSERKRLFFQGRPRYVIDPKEGTQDYNEMPEMDHNDWRDEESNRIRKFYEDAMKRDKGADWQKGGEAMLFDEDGKRIKQKTLKKTGGASKDDDSALSTSSEKLRPATREEKEKDYQDSALQTSFRLQYKKRLKDAGVEESTLPSGTTGDKDKFGDEAMYDDQGKRIKDKTFRKTGGANKDDDSALSASEGKRYSVVRHDEDYFESDNYDEAKHEADLVGGVVLDAKKDFKGIYKSQTYDESRASESEKIFKDVNRDTIDKLMNDFEDKLPKGHIVYEREIVNNAKGGKDIILRYGPDEEAEESHDELTLKQLMKLRDEEEGRLKGKKYGEHANPNTLMSPENWWRSLSENDQNKILKVYDLENITELKNIPTLARESITQKYTETHGYYIPKATESMPQGGCSLKTQEYWDTATPAKRANLIKISGESYDIAHNAWNELATENKTKLREGFYKMFAEEEEEQHGDLYNLEKKIGDGFAKSLYGKNTYKECTPEEKKHIEFLTNLPY